MGFFSDENAIFCREMVWGWMGIRGCNGSNANNGCRGSNGCRDNRGGMIRGSSAKRGCRGGRANRGGMIVGIAPIAQIATIVNGLTNGRFFCVWSENRNQKCNFAR